MVGSLEGFYLPQTLRDYGEKSNNLQLVWEIPAKV